MPLPFIQGSQHNKKKGTQGVTSKKSPKKGSGKR